MRAPNRHADGVLAESRALACLPSSRRCLSLWGAHWLERSGLVTLLLKETARADFPPARARGAQRRCQDAKRGLVEQAGRSVSSRAAVLPSRARLAHRRREGGEEVKEAEGG